MFQHPILQNHAPRFLFTAALFINSTVALAAPPAPRTIAWVLEFPHGLDHAGQAAQLRQQLAAAREGGAKIVCVEFGGTSWRIDVAQAVGDVLASSEPPAVAFIKSESGHAPLALLIAGARAGKGCHIEPGTTLVADAAGNARVLAEAKAVNAAESLWKQSDSKSPFGPYDALRAAVLNPASGCWMISSGSGKPDVRAGAPTAEAKSPTVLCEPGATTLKISTPNAIALGLLSAEAPDARAALEAALAKAGNSKPEMRERRPVGPPLRELRDHAESLLALADAAMDRAQPHLKLNANSNEIAPNRKRDAAARAKPDLDAAANAIREVESLLRSDPEILRLPAPDQAASGQRPAQFESRWRSKLQQAKDRLEKLSDKANKLANS